MKAYLAWLMFGFSVIAAAQTETLERTVTISKSYDARSLFINPSALGFQTELNGSELASSYNYGVAKGTEDELAFALTYGFLGFGVERLVAANSASYNRYNFALGAPITSTLFWGLRYRFTRSEDATLSHLNLLDFGLQFRPHPMVSVGFLANHINQPTYNGGPLATQFLLGTTVRPIRWLDLSVDVENRSNELGVFRAQFLGGFEIADGIRFLAGYHTDRKFIAGLQIHFGRGALYSAYASEPNQAFNVGVQMSTTPYASAIKPPTLLKVQIEPEMRDEPISGGLFTKAQPSSLELLNELAQAEQDPAIQVVLIKLDRFPLGLASAEELHDALLRLKRAGKEVAIFLSHATQLEYLVASAASRIYIARTGAIAFKGFQASHYFLKGTLDKIGVEGEFLAKGDYKSMPEMFTRKESSRLNREATLSLLKHLEDEYIRILQSARNIDREKYKGLLAKAVWSPEEAMEAGLVDGVASFSASLAVNKKAYLVTKSTDTKRDLLSLPPRVTVVVASGEMVSRNYFNIPFIGSRALTPQRFERTLKRALNDERTRAVVVRVNSPGGEILAADEIAQAIENARTDKPIVISMGDIAASGGYFMAAPSQKIFSNSLTLTGSIGVFFGKFNLSELYKKIDLRKEILTHAPYPGLFTEDRPWSAKERSIMEAQLNTFYATFTSYVRKHRKMTEVEVEHAAQGRVWTGREAETLRLVDQIGGYHEAVEEGAKLARLDLDNYDRQVLSSERGLLSLFEDDDENGSQGIASTFLTLLPAGFREEVAWSLRLRETAHPFLYYAPVEVH